MPCSTAFVPIGSMAAWWGFELRLGLGLGLGFRWPAATGGAAGHALHLAGQAQHLVGPACP